MAIDRPGAIAAALDFEPERSGGWRGADLFDARGMPAQPAGERSRRPPLRQGDRGAAIFRPDQPSRGQLAAIEHGDRRGDLGRTRCSTPNEGRREMVTPSQAGQRPRSARLPRTNPGSFPVDIDVERSGHRPTSSTEVREHGRRSTGRNTPTAGLSMATAPNPNGCRRGLSFAADRTQQHARGSRTGGH